MNDERTTDREAANDRNAARERAWQAYLQLPNRSRSEFRAHLDGFDAGAAWAKQESERDEK